MCPHGGAKSLIAASYFNRIATEKHLPYRAVAVAAEDPYASVPAPIANLLESDGLPVRSFKPRPVTGTDLRSASRVISVGSDLTKLNTRGTAVERWDDVPMLSDDLPRLAAAIRRHVILLVDQIGSRP
jgi:protein-tyrosine-phosphatase